MLMAAESEVLVKREPLVFDVDNAKPRTFGVFVRVVDAVGVKPTNIRTAFIINYLALVSGAVDDMNIQCCAHLLLSVVNGRRSGLVIANLNAVDMPNRIKTASAEKVKHYVARNNWFTARAKA